MSRNEQPPIFRNWRWPLYPRFVGFAASCFVGALATDIAYWRTANMMWSDFSAWLVTAGVVVGYVAIVVGLIETLALRSFRPGPNGLWMIGNLVALILATFNMLIHTRDAWTSVVPWGLALSAGVVLILLVTACVAGSGYDVARAEVTP